MGTVTSILLSFFALINSNGKYLCISVLMPLPIFCRIIAIQQQNILKYSYYCENKQIKLIMSQILIFAPLQLPHSNTYSICLPHLSTVRHHHQNEKKLIFSIDFFFFFFCKENFVSIFSFFFFLKYFICKTLTKCNRLILNC